MTWAYALWTAIALWWPADVQMQAWNVAMCESTGNPAAVNGPHKGTWQVNEGLHGTVSIDVRDQAGQAYTLWAATEDWSAWECKP